MHPKVKPVKIKIEKPQSHSKDFRKANEKVGLNKDTDPPVEKINESPDGYTWHHHEDGETMILVDRNIHREFTHIGGVSLTNN